MSEVIDTRTAERDSVADFVDALARKHPGEFAALVENLETSDGAAVVRDLDPANAAAILSRASGHVAVDLFSELGDRRTAVLDAMEPSRATALVGQVSEPERAQALAAMSPARGREIRKLLEYAPGSAGQIMDATVTTLRPDATVGEALGRVRRLFPRRVFDVFLVDYDGRLVGSVGLQDVATAPAGTLLSQLANPNPLRVADVAGRDEIAEILESHRVSCLPVVDFEQRIVGVIRYDALFDAVEREAVSTMQSMVGVSREERALSRIGFSVRKRLPWLQINLVTAFVAAAVVGLFENTIAQFTALAVLLPVVAGQSGNTGAQALAVIMRGLSLREITGRHWFRVVTKEGIVGMINGVAVALVTAFAVYLWSGSSGLAGVIGVSMVMSMALAAMAGASIPILLEAFGQDPAQASSIVLTTVTDVVGFLSFLGLATLASSVL